MSRKIANITLSLSLSVEEKGLIEMEARVKKHKNSIEHTLTEKNTKYVW